MISDLNGSPGSRQFLNVANERTCFASCMCTFKSSDLITRWECTSETLPMFLSHLNENDRG